MFTVLRTACLLGVMVMGFGACGGDGPEATVPSPEAVLSTTPEPRLPEAFAACDADDVTEVISMADAGRTVLVETRTEYGATQPVNCLFSLLGTSAAVTAQVDATTSLMGLQEVTEATLTYKWSYHPDSGLNMIITEE
ncbi:hypothetical protein ABKW28_20955 [Nocardioides sp. 31GB23]|uniref:hypothetical protein n=1 Tax=Nocardioides sp. 31GB23 TaxID=3156065 RepID=UPI0032AFD236